jgi:hypothetical protein
MSADVIGCHAIGLLVAAAGASVYGVTPAF